MISMDETDMEKNFFIGPDFTRLPAEKLAALKQYGACVAADALQGFCSMRGRIRSVVPGSVICGQAITVQLRAGDKLMLHRAIEIAEPGDIIVADTGGSYWHAAIGGLMSSAAFSKGVQGMVIDGAVRDVEELREHGYPVFAAELVTGTGGNAGPGRLNHPISCGNTPVMPGDVILADDNGVTVIPLRWVDWVLEGCARKLEAEAIRAEEIKNGILTAGGISKKLDVLGYRA